MVLEILAGVVVLFLLYVWLTYYKLSGVYVVRYSRPDCPFCVSSQADWDALKSAYNSRTPDVQKSLPVTFVDINTSNSVSLDTQIWKSKYSPASVPQVIVVYDNNIEEYKGPDNTQANIKAFIEGVFVKYGLPKAN